MPSFDPVDPSFADRVRESFGRQVFMKTIGALLTKVSPGEVHVELPFRSDLTQQHGFLHAAVVTAIVDTACGFAALTLAPPDAGVLTVEYKVNFMSPASGERMTAHARVLNQGARSPSAPETFTPGRQSTSVTSRRCSRRLRT